VRPLLLVFLPLLVAYATALKWCWDVWMLPDGYYGHGALLPGVAVLVVWLRRRQWRSAPVVPDRRGLWLLVPGLLLHLCGAALTIDSLSAASLVLALPGALLLALGRARLRGLWPVVWLVGFGVPMPLFVTGRLAFELKEFAIDAGLGLANLFGPLAGRSGAMVSIAGQAEGLVVADPCGGLRSLLAMLTIAYCLAFFVGPRRAGRRVVLMAVAAPLAVLVNVVRIAGLCWMAGWWGTGFAGGSGHEVMNVVAWVLDLGILLLLDARLSRGTSRPGPAPAPPPAGLEPAARALRVIPAVLWIAAGPLLALSLYRPAGGSAGRAEALPADLGAFALQERFEINLRYRQLLGTDDAAWRAYRAPDGASVFVVAVFHDTNWKSVHPPDICIQGSNMTIVESGSAQVQAGGEAIQVGRILATDRGSGRPYLSLFVYGTGELSTGSYGEFFMFHAPRALLRRSNSGFLLRVESYADGVGGVDGAEIRCAGLLAGLLPAARRLLP
jgi:EpsI family protein